MSRGVVEPLPWSLVQSEGSDSQAEARKGLNEPAYSDRRIFPRYYGKPIVLCSKHIHCTITVAVTNELKPATTETGLVVHVPAFIAVGEAVQVDTETGQYVSRAKE